MSGSSSVKVLNLSSNYSIKSAGWRTLLNQLPQTSVEHLDLSGNNIDSTGLNMLASINTLESLNLRYLKLCTPLGWRSFFNFLQTRGVQLKKLDVSGNNELGTEGVAALGSLLSNMRTLKVLKMSRYLVNITRQGWQTFFTSLQDPNLDLIRLDLGSNRIDNEEVELLMRSLSNMSSLKRLALGDMRLVTAIGWRQAFLGYNAQDSNLDLVKLDVSYNNIDDEGMQLLIRMVSSMSSLAHLNLNESRRVTPIGWQALVAYLQSPNFALKRLHLSDNVYNDDMIIAFTSALVHNKTLERLSLGGIYDEEDENPLVGLTKRGWEAVSTLLCNKTSIMDTYNSNHTLQNLGECDSEEFGDKLYPYLGVNENKDKAEVARQKILQTHFSTDEDGGNSKIQMLLDMELEMMPTTIAWIGRPVHHDWKGTNVSGLSIMFNLLRMVPDLFDSSTQKKSSGAGKRKRIA